MYRKTLTVLVVLSAGALLYARYGLPPDDASQPGTAPPERVFGRPDFGHEQPGQDKASPVDLRSTLHDELPSGEVAAISAVPYTAEMPRPFGVSDGELAQPSAKDLAPAPGTILRRSATGPVLSDEQRASYEAQALAD